MARKARQEFDAGVHHVFARGNDRQRIYLDDGDCGRYLELLGEVVARYRWRCLAYCLMPNHVHLLVETVEPNLGTGMHRLHTRYAQWFNRRRARTGHLFEGRYGSVSVENDPQFVMTAAYVAANPVLAGLVERPEDWDWSSYATSVEGSAHPWIASERLFELLGAWGGEPQRRYAELVAERLEAKRLERYFGGREAA